MIPEEYYNNLSHRPQPQQISRRLSIPSYQNMNEPPPVYSTTRNIPNALQARSRVSAAPSTSYIIGEELHTRNSSMQPLITAARPAIFSSPTQTGTQRVNITHQHVRAIESMQQHSVGTKRKALLSSNEGKYVKRIKKQMVEAQKTIFFSFHETTPVTPLSHQVFFVIESLCLFMEKNSDTFEDSVKLQQQLLTTLQKNPNIQTVNAEVAGGTMEMYGQKMALVVSQSTSGAGRPFSHTGHLMQLQEPHFGNDYINSFLNSKVKTVPDMKLSSMEHTRKSMSVWGSLSISDCIKIFLRIRDFSTAVQKKMIYFLQNSIHAFRPSLVAYDTVFFVSAGSFSTYSQNLNSLMEYVLLINHTWTQGSHKDRIKEKVIDASLDPYHILDLIMNDTITPQMVPQWVKWLAGKGLSFSYIKTKLAAVSFFFRHLKNVRIADFWSISQLNAFARNFKLQSAMGADYATPMIRAFLLFDVLPSNPKFEPLIIPCLIASIFGPRPKELHEAKLDHFSYASKRGGVTVSWFLPQVKNSLTSQVKKAWQPLDSPFFIQTRLQNWSPNTFLNPEGYVCEDQQGKRMTRGLFNKLFAEAVGILKNMWKEKHGECIKTLRFLWYTWRISKLNDLHLQNYTGQQIISISGHSSVRSLNTSYLCHADGLWADGLADCFQTNLSTNAVTEMFDDLTSLVKRRVTTNLVQSCLTDTVLGSQDELDPTRSLDGQEAITQIYPNPLPNITSCGILAPSIVHSTPEIDDDDADIIVLNTVPKDKKWKENNLKQWELKQNLAYKPSEIKDTPFYKKYIQPLYQDLEHNKQLLLTALSSIKYTGTEADKTKVQKIFRAQAAKVTEQQQKLLQKLQKETTAFSV